MNNFGSNAKRVTLKKKRITFEKIPAHTAKKIEERAVKAAVAAAKKVVKETVKASKQYNKNTVGEIVTIDTKFANLNTEREKETKNAAKNAIKIAENATKDAEKTAKKAEKTAKQAAKNASNAAGKYLKYMKTSIRNITKNNNDTNWKYI